MRWLWLCCLLLAPGAASAQDVGIASIETLRARAAARGFLRVDVPGSRAYEAWCAAPPCDAGEDRFELYVRDSALVELHVVDHAVGEGFVLDGTWQASGAFGFRFTRGDECGFRAT